jgi:CHASE3 domain sensor protein
MPNNSSSSVIKNLQVVFFISTVLLIISIGSSLFSTQKLVTSSEEVNHTHQVLIDAENLISYMKDAETGQRGYIITLDPTFLEPYDDARKNVIKTYENLMNITVDNPVQQKNLPAAKMYIDKKFDQMQTVINTKRLHKIIGDTVGIYREMLKGKRYMDDLRTVVLRIKQEEKRLLDIRAEEQDKFISFTPKLKGMWKKEQKNKRKNRTLIKKRLSVLLSWRELLKNYPTAIIAREVVIKSRMTWAVFPLL